MENKILDLDEGMMSNFIINKSAQLILKKIASNAKKDFEIIASYFRAAGLEASVLSSIKVLFRIKASKFDLISNHPIPSMKLESIEEGIFDSITDTYDAIVKYFNLFKIYRKFKELDKDGKFIENNKKTIVNACIWLLIINGDLIKYLNTFKKAFLEN